MHKFKKILQFLFKSFFEIFFKLLYGKIIIFNNKISGVNIFPLKKIYSDVDLKMSYHLYSIKNGRIYTDTTENVAIIQGNNLIPDVSFQQTANKLVEAKYNSVIKKGTPRLIKKYKGKVFSMVQGGSGNNYFHFIFDIIPRLKLLNEKYNLDEINFFYVPEVNEWQKQIYSIFKIPTEKLIDSKKYHHIFADEIIAVNHPWYRSGYIQNEIKNIPSWIVSWNREKYLPHAKNLNLNKKIYIDRSSSPYNHCKISNNTEVINFLTDKGFNIYKTEELKFLEQINLFQNSSTIIGAHGAAFTNIIFCKPHTNIIEIIPKHHPSLKCWRLSQILNLSYIRLKTPTLKNQSNGDIFLKVEILNELLNKLKS